MRSIMTLIPKGANKDPCVPLKNRCSSLLSCIQKIYSSILNKRFIQYVEYFDSLVDEQNCFRKKSSYVDHVYALASAVQNRPSVCEGIFAAFIDIQKAFDGVDGDLLFNKLLCNNISGKMHLAIESLSAKTSSCVKLNGICTHWFSKNTGVRQGDVISPKLFSIFINDMATGMKSLDKEVMCGHYKCFMLALSSFSQKMKRICKTFQTVSISGVKNRG